MGTTNFQIDELVNNLEINHFKGCFYKDQLDSLEQNSSYILNLENEFDLYENRNQGTHWVAVVTDFNKQVVYFDSFGQPIPKYVLNIFKRSGYKHGHTNKIIQNIKSDLCGYFSVAFIYFLTKHKHRTRDIYIDANIFVNLFEDLGKVNSTKNEHILSLFFKNKNNEILLKYNNWVKKKNQLAKDYQIEKVKLKS